jgi:hypothetical protein
MANSDSPCELMGVADAELLDRLAAFRQGLNKPLTDDWLDQEALSWMLEWSVLESELYRRRLN